MTRDKKIFILMAEDDADDRLLVQDAWNELELEIDLQFVTDGVELVNTLYAKVEVDNHQNHDLPDLVLLDLNMPRKSGQSALKEIKSHPKLQNIPVVVLTTSKNVDDINFCYHHGVAGFITKPTSYKELRNGIKVLYSYWFEIVTLPGRDSNG
jgi:CheY-like chemotaxis protein